MADFAGIKSTFEGHVFNTYGRLPVAFVEGEGCTLTDAEGKKYLDFVSGLAVVNLGHCHQRVTAAVLEQAKRLVHVSNLYYTEPQGLLAEKLTEHSFADRAFFCNSGAEAVEGALKLARKYSLDRYGPGRHSFISFEGSFHGRTFATLAATGQEKYKKGFEPLLEGFRFAEFGDLGSVESLLDETVCGIIVEPVQGEGGVRLADPGFFQGLRRLSDENDVILIFDEVQAGLGRTGKLFAHQQYGVAPHVMTLAKALANGLPAGCLLATEEAAGVLGPGTHAATFGGGPVIMAAALAVLEELTAPGFLPRVVEVAARLARGLDGLNEKFEIIKEHRGLGLMRGLELDRPCAKIVDAMLEKGFLVNCTRDNVLRLLPPLVVTEKEVDLLLEALGETFSEVPP